MINTILSEISPAYGFCRFSDVSEHLINCRGKLRIPKNAKSIIVAIFPYYLGDHAYDGANISKYAVVPDYHDTIGNLLLNATEKLKLAYPKEEFVSFTDNSPVPEVTAAVLAGLGVRGKNGMLINETYGSWIFIGDIITTMEFDYYDIGDKKLTCLNCDRCIRECPTNAISDKGVDKSICLSDITQRKGKLTEEMEQMIIKTGCAWGCDICQNVCPMNKSVRREPIKEFYKDVELKARNNSDITGRAYAWRGEEVIRRNLKILDRKNKERK